MDFMLKLARYDGAKTIENRSFLLNVHVRPGGVCPQDRLVEQLQGLGKVARFGTGGIVQIPPARHDEKCNAG